MTDRTVLLAAWQRLEGQMSMSKPHDFRWNPRRRVFAPPKPRPPQPISAMAIGVIVMFVIAAALAIYAYDHERTPATDAHVVHLQSQQGGFSGPFGRGRIELRFLDRAGVRHAAIVLTDAAGNRLAPQQGTVVTLETNPVAGARERIAFRPEGPTLVSASLVRQLTDRSTLVISDGMPLVQTLLCL